MRTCPRTWRDIRPQNALFVVTSDMKKALLHETYALTYDTRRALKMRNIVVSPLYHSLSLPNTNTCLTAKMYMIHAQVGRRHIFCEV